MEGGGYAHSLQMMVRMFQWSTWDLYQHYNIEHVDEKGNLPPPPNPDGIQRFMMACLEQTVNQINVENGADEKSQRQSRREQAEKQADFNTLKQQAQNNRL